MIQRLKETELDKIQKEIENTDCLGPPDEDYPSISLQSPNIYSLLASAKGEALLLSAIDKISRGEHHSSCETKNNCSCSKIIANEALENLREI